MAGMRTALLIATSHYRDSTFRQLQASTNDATTLAEVLARPDIGDYQVSTLDNQPADEIRRRIDDLFSQAGRDDLILLYFSGHGVKDEAGHLHLASIDTNRGRLRSTAVSAQFVRDAIDDSRAGKVVVWLDCCYGGAFPAGKVPKADGTVDVLHQLAPDSGRGCVVITASTHIQFAYESNDELADDSRRSVFTDVIVTGLRSGDADLNRDGWIDANEVRV